MKKICSIVLLVLLLFNLGAYQLCFEYFIYRSDHTITEQINNNRYGSNDLVEVKIPVHLNIGSWDDFRPISGQVKLSGNCYNYAKIKMTRDTLYLMCIPNNIRASLVRANIIYSREVNDILPLNKRAHLPLTKKSMSVNEYNYCETRYQVFNRAPEKKLRHNYAFAAIIKTTPVIPRQPPQPASLV